MYELKVNALVLLPTTQQSEVKTESDAFLSKAVLNDDALLEYRWRQCVDKCLRPSAGWQIGQIVRPMFICT